MNFCFESLGTTISSDQDGEDEFQVSNLLKYSNQLSTLLLAPVPTPTLPSTSSASLVQYSNTNNNAKGFMTAHFVRPPVKIKLHFPVPIEISHIVICPRVGKQCSSGFQLEAVITGRAQEPGEKFSLSTHLIGKEFINTNHTSRDAIPNILVFKNPRFQLKAQYCSLPLRQFELYRNYPKAFELRHTSFYACEKVLSLELTILRVSGSSVPAIGMLQVWGQPSVHSTKPQNIKLMETWLETVAHKKNLKRCRELDEHDGSKLDDTEDTRKKLKIQEEDITVPEYFLDPITFDIMCQPLILPSGIAIDSSTLEKYNLEEAKWGRLPNDPFTGLEFNGNSIRPIYDEALKSRIDTFISQNSNHKMLQNVPRVLGSSKTSGSNASTSTIPFPRTHLQRSQSIDNEDQEETLCKRSIVNSINSEEDDENITHHLLQPPTPKDLVSAELDKCFGNKSFEFIKKKKPKLSKDCESTNSTNKCIKCDLICSDTDEIHFYNSDTCNHILICKSCLVLQDRSTENICKVCKRKWFVKNLCRFFMVLKSSS